MAHSYSLTRAAALGAQPSLSLALSTYYSSQVRCIGRLLRRLHEPLPRTAVSVHHSFHISYPSQVHCVGRLLLHFYEQLHCTPSRRCRLCLYTVYFTLVRCFGSVLLCGYEPPRAQPSLYFTPYTLHLRRRATTADAYFTSSRHCTLRPALSVHYALFIIL